jgi:hypothetical protein
LHITGNSGDNLLLGSIAADYIEAFEGNDEIHGNAGSGSGICGTLQDSIP